MFWNILFIFISCIIILNFSRRNVAVIATLFIQKFFDYNIFLLSSEIILKIIKFLNFLITTIFFYANSVFTVFNLRVNVIIFVTFIFCILFIFKFFSIYVINFIFLLNCRFKNVLIVNIESVENATFAFLKILFV